MKRESRISSRRRFLGQTGSGLAGVALAHMLHEDGLLAAATPADPLAAKQPHHAPRAKSIIWLFMEGGPSHVDLFDPKPKLKELAGQPITATTRYCAVYGHPIKHSASPAMQTTRTAAIACGRTRRTITHAVSAHENTVAR